MKKNSATELSRIINNDFPGAHSAIVFSPNTIHSGRFNVSLWDLDIDPDKPLYASMAFDFSWVNALQGGNVVVFPVSDRQEMTDFLDNGAMPLWADGKTRPDRGKAND